ncbi:MAG: precorrin-6y C5,15-methyltransferase (decarboxylating) subunit CbiE [Acidimicrobiaceae bacterium]|nr:precorrin-6y C5,15-methyltransferase (decarboxylating) subunit CbiE [Acidimicrobiaceae bacterium]
MQQNLDSTDGPGISFIGLLSSEEKWIQPTVLEKIRQAKSIVGSKNRIASLSWLVGPTQTTFEFPSPMADIFDQMQKMPKPIVVLASGDPGYFGIVRLAALSLPKNSFEVIPNASSVAWAFARLAVNWEDATVISFHGRKHGSSLAELESSLVNPWTRKLALISSPEADAKALINAIRSTSSEEWQTHIFSNILSEKERHFSYSTKQSIHELDNLLAGEALDFSVVVAIRDPGNIPQTPSEPTITSHPSATLTRGRSSAFSPRTFITNDNPYTKAEVRAVILSKLCIDQLPLHARLVDLGAGVGTVGVSALALRPDLKVTFVERNAERLELVKKNLESFGFVGTLIHGENSEFPEIISNSESVFLGGGFSDFELVESLVRPTSSFVVASASLEHANRAGSRLGNLCQVAISRSASLVDGTLRLVSDNPVFISWREVNQDDI